MSNFKDVFPNAWFITLDDKGNKGSEPKREPRKDLIKEHGNNPDIQELIRLNQEGAGVFFTPNQFTTRRITTECLGVNAWIMEKDDLSKEEQLKLIEASPLPPSIIVESGKSLHAYWLAKNGTVDNYRTVVKGLIQYFKSDEACKDITRVLRVPGFFHNKKQPFKVKILKADYDLKYTEEEMMIAYQYEEEEYNTTCVVNEKIEEGLDFWGAVARFNNKEILLRLSGTYLVNYEKLSFRPRPGGGEYIDINGEPADCWLDQVGLIGSGKRACPTFVQWLEFYGWKKGDIAKWIAENCQDLLPESAKPRKDAVSSILEHIEEDEQDEIFNYSEPYTWGTNRLDAFISPIERESYIVLVGETAGGKTLYSFDMAYKNASIGKRVLYLSLEMTAEQLYSRTARGYAGINKLQWRNKKSIPEHQIEAYMRRKAELKDCKNLTMKGVPPNTIITMPVLHEYLTKVKDDFDLIFIDNFGFISPGNKQQLNHEEDVSRSIANLTKQNKVPIILIHHLKKGDGSNPRGLDAIRGSSKFTHDADNVIQIWRNMKDAPRITTVIEMKDRGWGQNASVDIEFSHGTFIDIVTEFEKEMAELKAQGKPPRVDIESMW